MQEAQPGGAVHDLAHYTRPLRRHWLLVALCAILGLSLGFYGNTKLHSSFTSNSKVLVVADITDQGVGNAVNGRTSGTVNLDTEAQLLKSEPMAAAVKTLLHSPASTRILAAGLTVTVPANTTILDLTYKARNAKAAQAGAQAYATAYLSNRVSLARQALNLQIAAVNKQLTSAGNKLHKATVTFAAARNGSAEQEFARQEMDYLQTQILNLNDQLDGLVTAPVVPGRVVSPASPAVKQTLKRDLLLLSGLLLGLLIGVLVAWGRDRFSRTIRSADDLGQIGIEVIAANTARARASRRRRGLHAGLGTPEHEAAAVIASRVDPGRAVYIAGVSSSTTATRVGGQIAQELQHFGATVRIIQLARDVDSAQASSETPFLHRGVDNPISGPFASPAGLHAVGLRAQIAAGRDRDDFVLLIGGDAERDPEGYLAAASADATLLIVEMGVTTRKALLAVTHEVSLARTSLIGAVIVSPERGAAKGAAHFTGSAAADRDTDPHRAQHPGGASLSASEWALDRPPLRRE